MLSTSAGVGSWLRLVVVLVVVLALTASLLVLAPTPVAAAAPGGCDADGDGAAGGSPGTVFSDGSDDAAAALAADTGVVLGEPEAAHRWRVVVCTEAGGEGGEGGTLRVAIETIEAGDLVLAFDPATGTWAPQEVSAAWSYLDTEIATLVLTDGSVVSATDHHRFYDAAAGTFVEAEDLDPATSSPPPRAWSAWPRSPCGPRRPPWCGSSPWRSTTPSPSSPATTPWPCTTRTSQAVSPRRARQGEYPTR